MNDNILDDFEANLYLEEGDDHEVVAKFYSPLEGELSAARLRSEGIPCFLANSMAQSVMPHLQVITRLHVRPQDLEQARTIIGEAAIDAEAQRSEPIQWGTAILIVLGIVFGLGLARLLITALWSN